MIWTNVLSLPSFNSKHRPEVETWCFFFKFCVMPFEDLIQSPTWGKFQNGSERVERCFALLSLLSSLTMKNCVCETLSVGGWGRTREEKKEWEADRGRKKERKKETKKAKNGGKRKERNEMERKASIEKGSRMCWLRSGCGLWTLTLLCKTGRQKKKT